MRTTFILKTFSFPSNRKDVNVKLKHVVVRYIFIVTSFLANAMESF